MAQGALAGPLGKVWEEAVDNTLAQPILQRGLAKRLDGVFETSELAGIQAFLTSDFGRRITVLENESMGIPQAQREKEAGPVLKNTSEERAKKLRTLIENAGGIESALALALNSTFAMMKGMQAAGNIPLQRFARNLARQISGKTQLA